MISEILSYVYKQNSEPENIMAFLYYNLAKDVVNDSE